MNIDGQNEEAPPRTRLGDGFGIHIGVIDGAQEWASAECMAFARPQMELCARTRASSAMEWDHLP